MIKKGMPVLLAVAIFILASCSTASPQNSYASDVAPAVEQLAKWQAHYADFETLLTGPIAPANGMSRLDMIELYNMATEYKITREDYGSMGFLPLDALVGDANKLAKEGHSIEAILNAATPDEKVQTAHQNILKCVQARDSFAEGLSSAIRNLDPVDLSGDVSSCSTFGADLETLTAYVNANK